jgi:pimeloyl-ACP methyl ester carboxylesterase
VNVYLPDGYSQTDRRYPTAYLIHGWGGDYTSFLGGATYGGSFSEPLTRRFSMATEADSLIAAGDLPPMILVFPNIANRTEPATSIPVASYLANVVALVDSSYRTIRDRDARVIGGHSVGGSDAMTVALAYPELFGSVGLLAPYFTTKPTPATFSGPIPLRFWVYVGANDKHELWWVGFGSGDPKDHLPAYIPELVGMMAALGIPHTFVQDDGDHNSMIRERLDGFLIYSARFLATRPQARSTTQDTVVAGSEVEWSARVEAPTQGFGAVSGGLRADLRGVGGPGVVALVSEGEGVYRLDPVRLAIPDTTGQRWVPLLDSQSPAQGPYSYLRLVVWPADDRDLFGDGPGPGWTWRQDNTAVLDTAATAVVSQGSRSLAVKAGGALKASCETTPPVSRVGYDSLALALYPSEGTALALEVGLNLHKRKNILKLVNWADKRWQQVALPLDSLGLEPKEDVTSIAFFGSLKGTFYLDDVRLIAAAAPAAPGMDGTAVQETYSAALPSVFVLDQNHPNPFNSDTVIRFDLPQAGEVALVLYNLVGQQVATLVQEAREAGAHAVLWNGEDEHGRALASGVYLYRLRTGSQEQTRKLLLLR